MRWQHKRSYWNINKRNKQRTNQFAPNHKHYFRLTCYHRVLLKPHLIKPAWFQFVVSFVSRLYMIYKFSRKIQKQKFKSVRKECHCIKHKTSKLTKIIGVSYPTNANVSLGRGRALAHSEKWLEVVKSLWFNVIIVLCIIYNQFPLHSLNKCINLHSWH